MDVSKLDMKDLGDGVAVKVKVQPRASKTAIVGMHGDSLKISLTSPPVDGEANDACIALFAKLLRVPKSKVLILTGQKSRIKVIKITDVAMQKFIDTITDY